jgi:hypothetical protein
MLGQLFRRMGRAREFPSRLMTLKKVPLEKCLQPGMVWQQQPTGAFPCGGIYKDGEYQALQGIDSNLVNVSSAASLYMQFGKIYVVCIHI